MPSVQPCSGDVPEQKPHHQPINPPGAQTHHAECHPAEDRRDPVIRFDEVVSFDELFDLAAKPAAMITHPACRGLHNRRSPRWLDRFHLDRGTFFGLWRDTARVLLYWAAAIGGIALLITVATPSIQAGALGLGGLSWLHHRHTTRGTRPPRPEPAPAV